MGQMDLAYSIEQLLTFFEILLTGYLMFYYKKLINMFGRKSIIIFIVIFLSHAINYDKLSIMMTAIIDIAYSLFLLALFYLVVKEKTNEKNL